MILEPSHDLIGIITLMYRGHGSQDDIPSDDHITLVHRPSLMCYYLPDWWLRKKISLYRIENLIIREDYPQDDLPVIEISPIEGIIALKYRSYRHVSRHSGSTTEL